MRLAIEDLGTVLGVWAHPDDEAYLSAGTMAALRDAGHHVVVATATYGESGKPEPERWAPAELAAVRRDELRASLALVGVGEHRWLGFADGACADVPLCDGQAAVAQLIADVAPDTILTFGPDGMTGHPDHRAVSAWATAAWQVAGARTRLLYATLTPRFHAEWAAVNDRVGLWMSGRGPVTPHHELALHVALTGVALDRKVAALRTHASQTAGLVDMLGEEDFRQWWSTEAFAAAIPPALRTEVGASRLRAPEPAATTHRRSWTPPG
jgi:LmbE family N-acetylglucosaminyl deacetylase